MGYGADGCKRIAQLVGKHDQKLILAPVGLHEGLLRLLALRHVLHQCEVAANEVARPEVRDQVRGDVPRAFARRQGRVEVDRLTGERLLHRGSNRLVRSRIQHLLHRLTDELVGALPEPFLILLVVEAIALVGVDIGDEHRQRIGNEP